MKTIVECVPNFSEGRDPGVIDRIASAIESVAGVGILHRTMDPDHHRAVITFVGDREGIAEGALRAIGKAAELIDLNRHSGVHPRIGAADVVPFVPVSNVTLQDCALIARAVGEEAYRRFGIPVYLYGAAALHTERARLENVRRGQFEGLRSELAGPTRRRPDFGGPELHPTAGATAVGARKFLIAYNIDLATSDVRLARHIARKIRSSSGGLPHVKAIGVSLKTREQVQVSINLTDFEISSLQRVFQVVRQEAGRLGARVSRSEIVGLVPRRALPPSFQSSLQLKDFRSDLVFENRLAAYLKQKKKELSTKTHEGSRRDTKRDGSASTARTAT